MIAHTHAVLLVPPFSWRNKCTLRTRFGLNLIAPKTLHTKLVLTSVVAELSMMTTCNVAEQTGEKSTFNIGLAAIDPCMSPFDSHGLCVLFKRSNRTQTHALTDLVWEGLLR
jgi:hypothetical protein